MPRSIQMPTVLESRDCPQNKRTHKHLRIALGILAGFLLVPVLHELGHLLVGTVLGYQVTGIKIGFWLVSESYVDFYVEELNRPALFALFLSGMACTFLLGTCRGEGLFRGTLALTLRCDLLIYSLVGCFWDTGDYYGITLLVGKSFALVALFVGLCSLGARRTRLGKGFSLLALAFLFLYPISGIFSLIALFVACLSAACNHRLFRGKHPTMFIPQDAPLGSKDVGTVVGK